MPTQTKQYIVSSGQRPGRLSGFKSWAGIFIVLFTVAMLLNLPFGQHTEAALKTALLRTFFWALGLSLWYFFRARRGVLTISDNVLETRPPFSSRKTRISRQEVLDVTEESLGFPGTKGLMIRKRGLPFEETIFIPSTFPDYESLKAELISWAPPKGT
jgi:hypothetical protein